MNNIKNEQGFALVSVLMILTILMVVSLSFMGQAANSIKQNQIVEDSSHSVAVAEMGVSYYEVAIQNIYEIKKEEIRGS